MHTTIPTVTIPDLTTDTAEVPIDDIEALWKRAEAAGDEALVILCERAANGFYGRLPQAERVEAMEQVRRVLAMGA